MNYVKKYIMGALCIFMTACGIEFGSPELSVASYFGMLEVGSLEAAKDFVDISVFTNDDKLERVMRNQMDRIHSCGGIEGLYSKTDYSGEDFASVKVSITFKDPKCPSLQDTVNVHRVGGSWNSFSHWKLFI